MHLGPVALGHVNNAAIYTSVCNLVPIRSSHTFSLRQEVEEVTARLCEVLHSSPQQFASLEVKVTETREALDIGHDDAALLVLSCMDEKGSSPPPPR